MALILFTLNTMLPKHVKAKQEDTVSVSPPYVSVPRVHTHEHTEPRAPTSEQQRIERALLKAVLARASQKDTAPEPRVPTTEQQRIERALLKAVPARTGQKDTAPEPRVSTHEQAVLSVPARVKAAIQRLQETATNLMAPINNTPIATRIRGAQIAVKQLQVAAIATKNSHGPAGNA